MRFACACLSVLYILCGLQPDTAHEVNSQGRAHIPPLNSNHPKTGGTNPNSLLEPVQAQSTFHIGQIAS